MAFALRLALYCQPGPGVEALLDRLADIPEITELLPFAQDWEGESLLWRGRPIALCNPSKPAAGGVDAVVFLDDRQLANDCLDHYLDAPGRDGSFENGAVVFDGTGVLDERGEGQWYWGGDSLPAEVGRISLADAVVSHSLTFLQHISAPLNALALSVCLPVSQRGKPGIDSLAAESARLLNGQAIEQFGLGSQIAFNVLPDVGHQLALQYEHQLRAILGADVSVRCHCFTVPVFFGHTISVIADTAETIGYSKVLESLGQSTRLNIDESAVAANLGDDLGIEIASVTLDTQSDKRLRATLIGDNLRDGVVSNLVSALEILIKSDT